MWELGEGNLPWLPDWHENEGLQESSTAIVAVIVYRKFGASRESVDDDGDDYG